MLCQYSLMPACSLCLPSQDLSTVNHAGSCVLVWHEADERRVSMAALRCRTQLAGALYFDCTDMQQAPTILMDTKQHTGLPARVHSQRSWVRAGRGFVVSMPTTMTAGMKPQWK